MKFHFLIIIVFLKCIKADYVLSYEDFQYRFNPLKEFDSIQEDITKNIKQCKNMKLNFYGKNPNYFEHCYEYEKHSCKSALDNYIKTQNLNVLYYKLVVVLCSKDYYGNPCPIAEFLKKFNEKLNEQYSTDSYEEYLNITEEVNQLSLLEPQYINATCDTSKTCLDRAIFYVGNTYKYLNSTECSSRLNITEVNQESNSSKKMPSSFSLSFLIIILLSISFI